RGRAAGALHRCLRERPRGRQAAGRHGPEDARRAADRALLDARPHGGARPRGVVGGAPHEVLLRPADRQPQGGRPQQRQHREVGVVDLARREQGRGAVRSAARRARALGEDQERAHRQLPVRRADDLERRPARRQGPDRRVRGGASQHADGQSRAAARDPAHDPQLRSVPRLRIARDVGRGRGDRVGAGALKRCRETAMQIERWTGRVIGGPIEDVYVYEAPVRIWHWVTVVCLAVLVVTGYFIGAPPPAAKVEPVFAFQMGWYRMVHFVAAMVVICAFLVRIYWAFAGNAHARHLFLPPMWSGAFWRGLGSDVRSYLFIASE